MSLTLCACRYAMKTLEKSEMLERNKVSGLHWDAPGGCSPNQRPAHMQGMLSNTYLQGICVAVGAARTFPGPQQGLLVVVYAA